MWSFKLNFSFKKLEFEVTSPVKNNVYQFKMPLCFIFIISFFFLLTSCGQGIDAISHVGVCDGYENYQTSDYVLPWAMGETYEVSQGNCSEYSHWGNTSRFAYDFNMPIGTDVHASRAGKVIEVVESHSDGNGCPDDNHIYVKHSDGTVAAYVHLTKDGSEVSVNEDVSEGQKIGESGNTGCSSGAHLHFSVFKDSNLDEGVPVTFKYTAPNPRGAREGKFYFNEYR